MKQVEAMSFSKQSRRGRHSAKPLNNIFGGLGKCDLCGSTMTMTNKGSGNIYFVCTRAKAGANCSYKTIHYNKVETYFKLGYQELFNNMPDTSEALTRSLHNLEVIKAHLEWLNESISNLVDAIENRIGVTISTTLLERLGVLEEEKVKTLALETEENGKLELVERNMVKLRKDTLLKLLSQDSLEKEKVNATLRQIFKAIHISIEKKTLEFEWLHSPTRTCINFSKDPVITIHKGTANVERIIPAPLPNSAVSIKDLAARALQAKREKDDLLS